MLAASRGAVTTKGFELEAARMGRLMREQYNIGFVDVGGWDTHVNEGGAQGQLATNLENLGRGLRTFADTLGGEWHNAVVMVVSEFGRTFRENGNGGTDHGHGSRLLGTRRRAARRPRRRRPGARRPRRRCSRTGIIPVLNNYRAVLAGLFRPLWSLSTAAAGTHLSVDRTGGPRPRLMLPWRST